MTGHDGRPGADALAAARPPHLPVGSRTDIGHDLPARRTVLAHSDTSIRDLDAPDSIQQTRKYVRVSLGLTRRAAGRMEQRLYPDNTTDLATEREAAAAAATAAAAGSEETAGQHRDHAEDIAWAELPRIRTARWSSGGRRSRRMRSVAVADVHDEAARISLARSGGARGHARFLRRRAGAGRRTRWARPVPTR